MKTIRLLAVALIAMAGFIVQSNAQLQTAGTLLVSVDASNAPLGFLFEITNSGSLGGVFQASLPGGAGLNSPGVQSNTEVYINQTNTNVFVKQVVNHQPVVINVGNGTKAIDFDGRSFLANVITNAAAVGTTTNLPMVFGGLGGTNVTNFTLAVGTNFLNWNTNALLAAGLAVGNSTNSIEAWVNYPAISQEGTIVAWGARNAGSNFSFNVGISSGQGAVNRNSAGTNDMNWPGGPPTNNVWHHVVYTSDGTTAKVYCDGILCNSQAFSGVASLNPNPNSPVTIGSQRALNTFGGVTNLPGTLNNQGVGAAADGSARTAMMLAKLRIHSGTLTPAQIVNNYNLEAPFFTNNPTPLSSGPTHRWSFSEAAGDAVGATTADTGSVGGATGTILGTSPGTALFLGDRLYLMGRTANNTGNTTGTQGPPYVDLPNGLLSSLSASNAGTGLVSIEGWFYTRGQRTWSRYFTFGTTDVPLGTSFTGEQPTSVILSNIGTGGRRYLDYDQGSGNRGTMRFEQDVNPLATNFNSSPVVRTADDFRYDVLNTPYDLRHFVVTWNESTGETIVYANGMQLSRQYFVGKMNQIQDVNNWLGRSLFNGDNATRGEYDEFRMYDRVLTPGEVQMNDMSGPDQIITAPLGTVSAVRLAMNASELWQGTYRQLRTVADYSSGATNINVTGGQSVVYSSSDTNIATVAPSGRVNVVGSGSVVLTATLGAQSASITNTAGPVPSTLVHQYTFNVDASDSINPGPGDGTVNGGFVSGGKALFDPSFNSHVVLPANIIAGLDAVTIEAWADFRGSGNNAMFAAFGDQNALTGQGRDYVFFSTRSGTTTRSAQGDNDPGSDHEFSATGNGNQDNKTNVHTVAIFNPLQGRLETWVNGLRIGLNTNVFVPLTTVRDVVSYIGRSLFTADPYLNADIDEFRIYKGVLSQQQIVLDAATGPNLTVTNPGALVSVALSEPFPLVPVPVSQQAVFTGIFANVSNVNLFAFGVGGATTVTSTDTNIVTFDATGRLIAVSNGSTTITASFGGKSATNTINVFLLTPTLQHRWTFNTNMDDVLNPGAANAGTLAGGATQVTGTKGQVLLNSNTSDFIDMPTNLMSGLFATTIEIWASFSATNVPGYWLWSFGNQNGSFNGGNYIYFSPRVTATGVARTGITANDPGTAGEQNASTTGAFGIQDGVTNVHIVSVFSPFEGYEKLYINDILRAQNTNVTFLLSQVINNKTLLGKSLYDVGLVAYPSNQPYMNGAIDEFRIYSGVVTSNQIALDGGAGPDLIVTNPGALSSVKVVAPPTIPWGDTSNMLVLANFANVSNVNAYGYDANGVVTNTSSDTNIIAIGTVGQLIAMGYGTCTISVGYGGQPVINTNISVTPSSRGPVQLVNRWSFNDAANSPTVADSVGGATGTIMTTNTSWTFVSNGVLNLNAPAYQSGGRDGYVNLPNGIISNRNNITIEVLQTKSLITAGANWSRLFDFGSSTPDWQEDPVAGSGYNGESYIFLSHLGGQGTLRFAVSTNQSGGPEFSILTGPTLQIGTTQMVQVVYQPSNNFAGLYTNGVLVASATAPLPLSLITNNNNWIGRSGYTADTDLLGTIDEFRIWEGRLQDVEMQRFASNLTASFDVQLNIIANTPTIITVNWPDFAGRYGVQVSTDLVNWNFITNNATAPITSGGKRRVTLTKNGSPLYIRLRD